MKNYHKIFFVLFPYIIFSSCNKDKLPPITTLPQEIKDYMYFKKGTYWVYKDTVAGTSDSTLVLNDNIEICEFRDPKLKHNKIIRREECFSYQTYSYYSNFYYNYASGYVGATKLCQNNCFLIGRNKSLDGNNVIHSTEVFIYEPIINDNTIGENLDEISVKAIYDSLKVGGIYYKDVVIINEVQNSTESNSETNFYIAKHYGIIRKEINSSNQVWDIFRYHIVQ